MTQWKASSCSFSSSGYLMKAEQPQQKKLKQKPNEDGDESSISLQRNREVDQGLDHAHSQGLEAILS